VQEPFPLFLPPPVLRSTSSGDDLNGDSVFNDRPAWATNLSWPSVVGTRYGIFDTNPTPAQIGAPRNIGNARGPFTMNVRVSKSFGFGEKPATPTAASQFQAAPVPSQHGKHGTHGGSSSVPGRYSVTFSVSARNLFNIVNPARPVWNLSSPLFGTSVALAGLGHHSGASANRMLEFQVRFSF
jgi:hypothetical protein